MASLQEMYSGSMLTRVSISAQALPQSNRTLPPPAPQRAELHPGMGLEELHSQAACTVKKTGGLHSQCSPTCTHPARSLPSSLSSGRELELHGILTDTQNAGPQSLAESSRAMAKCTGIREKQDRVSKPSSSIYYPSWASVSGWDPTETYSETRAQVQVDDLEGELLKDQPGAGKEKKPTQGEYHGSHQGILSREQMAAHLRSKRTRGLIL